MLRFRLLSLFTLLSLSTAPLAAQSPAPLAAPRPVPPVKLGGYAQIRGIYQDGPGVSFWVNQARLGIGGGITPTVSWKGLAEFRTGAVGPGKASVALLEAWVRWQPGVVAVQAGQFKPPFSREALASDADLETLDRALVVDQLAPKRDIGVMAEYAPGKLATIAAGVFNGEGMNVTTNVDSMPIGVARATLRPVPQLLLGASGLTYFRDSTRYGADASWEHARVTLRAEFVGQHRAATDLVPAGSDHGWAFLGAVTPLPLLQLVGRWETFERAGYPSALHTWTAGASLFFAERRVRVTTEYTERTPVVPGASRGAVRGQVQVRF